MLKESAISYIRRRRKESFEKALTPQNYEVERGIEEYENVLPRFRGKSLTQYFQERLSENGGISVLDVGCGSGIVLVELKGKFPNLKVSGVSGYDFRQVIKDPKQYEIAKDQLDYQVGDIQKLRRIFKGNKFDFIVSVTTLFYAGDPLNVVRQCYELLKPGGILFLDIGGLSIPHNDAVLLQEYWVRRGIEAEVVPYTSFSIRKGMVGKLPMPFIYLKPGPRAPRGYVLDKKVVLASV